MVCLDAIQGLLVKRYGRQHSAKYVIAIRSLLRYLARTTLVNYAAVQRILTDVKVTQDPTETRPLTFATSEIWTLLRQCLEDPSPIKGSRDLALISLAASTGGRRSELVRVSFSDLDLVNRFVKFEVKGGGRRDAAVHPATKEHLEQWLLRRGDVAGPLFPALRRGGHISEEALSDHQYWKILRERCEVAGIDPAIAPHDLRRWFVDSLLENGVDVFQVMRSVGHKRIRNDFSL